MILALNCGSTRFPLIINSLEEAGAMVTIARAAQADQLPEGISGIVISGSPHLLDKEPSPLVHTLNWIRDVHIPVLGICFGHQVIGLLHKATVYTGPENRNSVTITIRREDPLFKNLPVNPVFCADHTEGINLPEEFNLLASSPEYAVEAMKHIRKPVYGLQFHPEDSGEEGRIIFRNFLDIVRNHTFE